ncbi:hypothetical protein Pmani_008020 [Petrolisthes manimaculis]|uniref:Uncharacterized protein n=1 Tax=Petrolisthes manimaculis TaxID=1843537 RepID=A0AAE1Q7T0_9EUCA|nr:hypothetical protein Pmani_008020 [Petrolisthes manimaculis]
MPTLSLTLGTALLELRPVLLSNCFDVTGVSGPPGTLVFTVVALLNTHTLHFSTLKIMMAIPSLLVL